MKNVSASTIMLTKVKWTDMFDSEQELLDVFSKVDAVKFEKNGYKGYEYVKSFKRQLDNGRELSPKQITQLKRISKEIYRYHFGM